MNNGQNDINEHKNRIEECFPKLFENIKNISIKKNTDTTEERSINSASTHIVSAIINNEEKSFYVKSCGCGKKTSKLDNKDSKINAKELFMYKLLEYMGAGPRVEFIINNNVKDSYIVTEAVKNIKIDNEANKEYIKNFMNSKNKNDAVELSRVLLLVDLINLKDVFPYNSANYGIMEVENTRQRRIIFVDHLPAKSDQGFLFTTFDSAKKHQYSPRKNFGENSSKAEKTDINSDSNMYNNYNNYNNNGVVKSWAKKELSQDTNDSVLGNNNLTNAIKQALIDINNLIDKNPDSFSIDQEKCNNIDSKEILENFVNNINYNIKNYYDTEYYKQKNTGRA